MNRRSFLAAGAALSLAGRAWAAGESMRIVVGSGAGSASDGLARIYAKHLQKFGVRATVEDQPAAGGKLAARRLSLAKPDEDLMAFLPTGLLYSSLLGEEGVDWDMSRFGWVGSFNKDRRALVVTGQSGAARFEDLATRPKPLILATTTVASPGYYEPQIIRYLTGAKLKVVPGFIGGERDLAMVSGEVQGIEGSLDGLDPVLQLPGAHILLRVNDLALLPGQKGQGLDAPSLRRFARGPDAAPLLQLINAHAQLGRIAALPPGAPPAKLALWRARTDQVMADPAFIKDASAAGYFIERTSGAAVNATLAALLAQRSTQVKAAVLRALAGADGV